MKIKIRIIILFLLFFPAVALAAQAGSPIVLESPHVNTADKASVLRGGKFFAQNCMVCHTMKYLKHNELAEKAGVTLDKMPLENKEWWLGIVPPDLTLIARQRGAAWLYTYFHSFYKDPSRPTGYNNLLMKDVNMLNVFATYQGDQVLTEEGKETLKENQYYGKPHYYTVLKLVRSGSMTPEEFDQTTTDLVNFLVYASDPEKAKREYLGLWVLVFLFIFIVLTYFLKKAFWKDVE